MKRKVLTIILAALVLVVDVLPITAHAATVDGCNIGTYTLYSTFTATNGHEGTWTQNHANSNEAYGKLVDGNTGTKWCTISQNSFNTIWIEFSAAEPFIPKGYLLTTGGDTATNANRNPKNWTLKAKLNAGDAWTTIASVTNDTVIQAQNTTTYKFPLESNTNAYKYFRFEITAIRGVAGNGDWTMQLAELRFYGTAVMVHHAAKAATCTEAGNVEYYQRMSDGKYFSDSGCTSELTAGDVFISELGHDWVKGATIAPTCTNNGYTVYTCSRCPAEKHDDIVLSSGGEHDWSDWTQTQAQTCTSASEETRTCSICGADETRTVAAALGHDLIAGATTAATCTTDGYTVYGCSRCDHTEHGDIVPAFGHTWGEWNTTATCTGAGTETRTCSVCGATETRDAAALGHTWGEWETNATCTEAGTETRTCTVCGATETRDAAALGHDWGDWVVTTPATCQANGEETRACSRCDASEHRSIDKGPHVFDTEEYTVYYEPTCTNYGSEYRTCTVCGKNIYRSTDPLGHNMEYETAYGPTCTEYGYELFICTRYGCDHTEHRDKVAALGHDFENGVCTCCGAIATEISDWASLMTAFTNGGSYKLVADVTDTSNSGYLNVPAGISVSLDLNGHTMNRNLLEYGIGGGFVIKVAGTLTISDGVGGGTITGGYNVHDFFYHESEDCCGGVTVKEGGVFILYGGSITGNKVYAGDRGYAHGGGVYVGEGASFFMFGGSITNNTTTNAGNNGSAGGGVYIDEDATFNMFGGSITGNKTIAKKAFYADAAGVYVDGAFNVSGLVTISGNLISYDSGSSFKNNDVVLHGDRLINVVGPLDPSSLITYYSSYYPSSEPIVITKGLDGNGTYNNFATSISQYSSGCADIYLSGTEAALCQAFQMTVGSHEHGEIAIDGGLIGVAGKTITVTATSDEGYFVSAVTYTDGFGTQAAIPTGTPGVYTFTMPYYSATVSATFTENPAATVSGGIENGSITLSVGGTPIASGSHVAPGATVTITATGDDGYGVSSVTVGGTPIAAVAGVYSFAMPTTDVTVSATFATLYRITVDESWRVTLTPDKEYAVAGETVTVTATSEYGYIINYIYDVYDQIDDIYPENDMLSFTMPSGNVKLRAIFNSPKVTFDYRSYNGTAAVVGGEYNPAEGDTVTVKLTPDDGYTASRMRVYYLDQYDNQIDIDSVFNSATGTGTFTMPACDVIVEVGFVPYATVTVQSISHGTATITVGGDVVQSGGQVPAYSVVTVTFTPNSGYNFNSSYISIYWLNGNNEEYIYCDTDGNLYAFVMPSYDVIIEAHFDPDNIHIAITGEGTATASKYYAHKDEEICVSVTPAPGYFLKRITDATGNIIFDYRNDSYYFQMGDDGITVNVEFVPLPTVTVQDMEHGSASITFNGNAVQSGSGVPIDTTVTVTYTANDGYYLGEDSPDIYTLDENEQKHHVEYYIMNKDECHSYLVCYFNMPDDDIIIGASYYTSNVNVTKTGEGTIIPDKAYADVGESIYFTVTPADGYILKNVVAWDGHAVVGCTYDENQQGATEEFRVTMPRDCNVLTFNAEFVTPSFSGHRMRLESEIGVSFKVDFSGGYEYYGYKDDCYVTFSVSDGRTGRMDGIEADYEGGFYWFTGYINALELADTITATLHRHDGSVLATNTYSAMEYIGYVREHNSEDTKLMALVDALQDYGHYLQQSGWTDEQAHAAIAAATTEFDEDDIAAAIAAIADNDNYNIAKDLGAGIEKAKFSLTVNERTVINIKVKPNENVTVTKYDDTEIIGGETYYVIKSNEINASELLTKGTITVKTNAGDATFELSAASYIKSLLNNKSQTAAKKYAMMALDDYAKAAYDYSH